MPDTIDGSNPTAVSLETGATSEASSSLMDLYVASLAGSDAGDGEVTTEVTEPVEGGSPDTAEAATESGTPTQTEDEWSWEKYSSKPIPVKVAGQESQVPLEELRNGYMRQADYTRKTQELAEAQRLAEWAEGFQRQLRENPQQVLRTLAAAFQEDATPEIDPYEAELAKLVETDPELKPMAQMLVRERRERLELERQLQEQASQAQRWEMSQQQRDAIAAVEAEIADVKSRIPDFDENIAIQIAASKPGLNLEEAWVLYRGLNPAPVSQETVATPPAVPAAAPVVDSNRAAKEALAASTTNSRLQGKADVPADEYETFEELFEIMARTAQR